MVRRAVAVLTGLGLIGGAATVAYNKHGDATVKIKDAAGVVHTVTISGNGQKQFSCPSGEDSRLQSHDILAARIKLTLQGVRRSEHAIETRYPSAHAAPTAVILRYRKLHSRDNKLVDAFNAQIDEHNAIISRDCTAN